VILRTGFFQLISLFQTGYSLPENKHKSVHVPLLESSCSSSFHPNALCAKSYRLPFEENNNQVKVSTYGEKIGAGFTVYYDGEYDIKEITQEQFRQQAIDYIVGKRIDRNIVLGLVKDDLDYFIECFERVIDYRKDTNIEYTISGILPGAALYQKGVLLINNGEIAILFLDCRTKPMSYKYYTNGSKKYFSYLAINDWIKENGNLQVSEKK